MTRVLHVISELGVGGAETMVLEMVRRGPTVRWTSAVASAPGSRVPQVLEAGAQHFPLPLVGRNPKALTMAVLRLRRALQDFSPDVVITHNVVATLALALALATTRHSRWPDHGGNGPRTTRPPVIAVFHGVAARHYPVAARLLRRTSGLVVAVSDALRDRLVTSGLPRERVTVIRNAVSPPQLPPRGQSRRELGLADDVPVALCLARLAVQKRHDVLLRAWSLLGDHAVLLLAGDGEERRTLQQQARHLGLGEDRVRFLGNRDDVPRLLAAADLSVLASDWEGLPISMLESMAAGLPVVCTAVDGLVEVVQDGEGILVPPQNPPALAEALSQLLFDEDRRRACAVAARKGILERFDAATMMDRYAELGARRC